MYGGAKQACAVILLTIFILPLMLQTSCWDAEARPTIIGKSAPPTLFLHEIGFYLRRVFLISFMSVTTVGISCSGN